MVVFKFIFIGMNAAVRSVVRISIQLGINVFIVKEGYHGLIEGENYIVKASWHDVSFILNLVRFYYFFFFYNWE